MTAPTQPEAELGSRLRSLEAAAEKVDLQLLEERLQLLSTKRALAAVRCQKFLTAIEAALPSCDSLSAGERTPAGATSAYIRHRMRKPQTRRSSLDLPPAPAFAKDAPAMRSMCPPKPRRRSLDMTIQKPCRKAASLAACGWGTAHSGRDKAPPPIPPSPVPFQQDLTSVPGNSTLSLPDLQRIVEPQPSQNVPDIFSLGQTAECWAPQPNGGGAQAALAVRSKSIRYTVGAQATTPARTEALVASRSVSVGMGTSGEGPCSAQASRGPPRRGKGAFLDTDAGSRQLLYVEGRGTAWRRGHEEISNADMEGGQQCSRQPGTQCLKHSWSSSTSSDVDSEIVPGAWWGADAGGGVAERPAVSASFLGNPLSHRRRRLSVDMDMGAAQYYGLVKPKSVAPPGEGHEKCSMGSKNIS